LDGFNELPYPGNSGLKRFSGLNFSISYPH